MNNWTAKSQKDYHELARAVATCYGHKYDRAVKYLEELANNDFWRESELKALPWHSLPANNQGVLDARYVMHPAVLNSLAPVMPLRHVSEKSVEHKEPLLFELQEISEFKEKQVAEFLGRDLLGNSSNVTVSIYFFSTEIFDS